MLLIEPVGYPRKCSAVLPDCGALGLVVAVRSLPVGTEGSHGHRFRRARRPPDTAWECYRGCWWRTTLADGWGQAPSVRRWHTFGTRRTWTDGAWPHPSAVN